MKKIYQILIGLVLLIGVIFVYLNIERIFSFFNIDINVIIVNVVIINVIVYLIRTVVIRISNFFLRGKFSRYIISIIINLIWIGFIFWLIFVIDETNVIFTSMISFLITAVSLTFRDRINNIASGVLILISGSFEVGDLIEIKGIQGVVSEISLNYTKIRGIDGLFRYIPNTSAYNAAVKKFTHFITYEMSSENSNDFELDDKGKFKGYVKKFSGIISKDEKITRYIKIGQILSIQSPEVIDEKLSKVFDKYEKIFEIRPFYYINNTTFDRCSVTFQIVTKKPKLVLYYLNSFLRDILYELYEEKIYLDWDKEKLITPNKMEERD